MAYLVETDRICDQDGCTHRAIVQLRNNVNAAIGDFCGVHGRRRLAEQQASEKAAYAAKRSQ